MYLVKILFKNNSEEIEKYYCKKYKKMFVLSSYKDCAIKFKNIRSAKRSITLFKKEFSEHLRGYGDILEYKIIKESE